MKEEKTDKKRWEDPIERNKIKEAINDAIKSGDKQRIRIVLWSIEGSPWEEYAKKEIGMFLMANVFFDNTPRFV